MDAVNALNMHPWFHISLIVSMQYILDSGVGGGGGGGGVHISMKQQIFASDFTRSCL